MTTSLICARPGVAGSGNCSSSSRPRVSMKWHEISVGIRPAASLDTSCRLEGDERLIDRVGGAVAET